MALGKASFVLIAFAACLAVAAGDKEPAPTKEQMEAYMDQCRKVFPIEDDEFKSLKSHERLENPDRLTKCYVHCVMDKAKMFNAEGGFDVDRIYECVTSKHKKELKEDPLNAIKECTAKSTQTHKCEKAFAATRCFNDKKLL